MMCLIQINNLRVFFKLRLLLWSFFNLQMYTHIQATPHVFYLEQLSAQSQLLCLVNKNVGTCTYIEDRRLPSESMYVPVRMCVFNFFSLKPQDQ